MLPTQLGKHFWPDFTIVSGIRIDYLSPTLYLTDILIILLFCCFVARWLKKQSKSKLQLKNKKWLLTSSFVLLFLVINIVLSTRPLLSFYGLVKLGEVAFSAFYIAQMIRSRIQLEQVALLFAVSSLFESILAIMQYIQQGSLNGIFYYFGERTFTGATPGIANASINGILVLRPYATFPHPNVLAGYLLVALVLVWQFALKSTRRWVQLVGGISLLVSSIALLLTFGRIAIFIWLVFVSGVFMKVLFQKVKTFRATMTAVFLTASCLGIVSLVPFIQDIIFRFVQTSFFEESVTERTELLGASWKMIQEHLFFGVGLDNFIPSLAPLQKPMPLGLYLQPVHNIVVLIAAETGIIGLGLFIWLLVARAVSMKNQKARIKGVFGILFLVILVTGMFDHYWLTLQQGQLLIATVLGLAWTNISE